MDRLRKLWQFRWNCHVNQTKLKWALSPDHSGVAYFNGLAVCSAD